jgi:hypothetical protein
MKLKYYSLDIGNNKIKSVNDFKGFKSPLNNIESLNVLRNPFYSYR